MSPFPRLPISSAPLHVHGPRLEKQETGNSWYRRNEGRNSREERLVEKWPRDPGDISPFGESTDTFLRYSIHSLTSRQSGFSMSEVIAFRFRNENNLDGEKGTTRKKGKTKEQDQIHTRKRKTEKREREWE